MTVDDAGVRNHHETASYTNLSMRPATVRNMDYFKLKIMQACGYLNSKYIRSVKDLNERFALT